MALKPCQVTMLGPNLNSFSLWLGVWTKSLSNQATFDSCHLLYLLLLEATLANLTILLPYLPCCLLKKSTCVPGTTLRYIWIYVPVRHLLCTKDVLKKEKAAFKTLRLHSHEEVINRFPTASICHYLLPS